MVRCQWLDVTIRKRGCNHLGVTARVHAGTSHHDDRADSRALLEGDESIRDVVE